MRWLRSLRIKDVLKFLPLGVLLPVGIGAASVSPHDAISNISKWIEFIGVRDVPTWVAQKSADRTFLEFCVFLSIIYAIFIFRRQLSAFVLKDQFERLQRPSGDSMSMSVLVGKEAIAAAGTLTPTIDRFTPLAVSDSQHIEQRLIVVLTRNVPFHSELGILKPYIDVWTHFVNASVYDLTVEHIEGRFRLMGSHLPEPPVIWSLNIPDAGVLRHGTERSIVIRQWLTSDVAQRLMQTLPANILGEQKFDLRTGEAAIYFSFIDVDGNRKEFRKGLPDVAMQ